MSIICVQYPVGTHNCLLDECCKVGEMVIALKTMTELGIQTYCREELKGLNGGLYTTP